ncbi:MAG: bile acid:sodium symporter family protein [Gammaproteobacteria bacterium]|jgi:BASS family bile acid:Na+ symporter|nr:bile acid:sodium symporter family protein [Gammaproteobacteria bacterium]MBT3860028.1 bile acid:sodium symporter family protein [Gammaproteobacteria bacterium]MBT3987022.1 bile acid:sodium symporter family protein [Gammaproteobacteria bacterium]MBT4256756.1 bile acid:sodium symporter family protein [Gammaproteobacteria bacterium]MBT4580713.1 bile acid:sodium symporter family protein [Gammaproteobacteria bacterium]
MSRLNNLFPLWAVLVSISAFYFNTQFSRLEGLIVPLLASVMFIMGLTLTRDDIYRIAKDPRAIFVGVLLQFLLMPFLALTLANMLQLSNQLTIGMVLVGSCAGGTASNVICYLAKGDVALSISMTMVSTLVGVVATPLLCTFYLSETVDVDTIALLFSILQMVFVPVLLGFSVNHFFHKQVLKIEEHLPSASILVILLIIGIVVSLNSGRLLDVGLLTLAAVILHNLSGIAGGFYVSRLLGLDLRQSQTIAIEVGMQNSGLGVALALQFFSATAALPGALFSVWHNISGSILASIWAKKRTSLEYLLRDEKNEELPLAGRKTKPEKE